VVLLQKQVDCWLCISISGNGSLLAVDVLRVYNGSSQQNVGIMHVYLSGTGQIGPEILELDETDFVQGSRNNR
jgi:hypothetical protein